MSTLIMFPLFAFLNNLNMTSIAMLGIVGLLLFGKDLPLIARNLAKEYFRYKKMINDATADIQREMESAATVLENEKRNFQSEINSTVPSIDNVMNSDADSSYDSAASYNMNSDYSAPHNTIATPAKPTADPLSLDVPAPSSLSHRATDAAKSPSAQVAALDTYQKSVPAPSKIPPPL